jgi:DNA mismatch repair protein MutS2
MVDLYPSSIFDSLDFNFIRKEIAQNCFSAGAKNLALNLIPQAQRAQIEHSLFTTDEILALFLANETFPTVQFLPITEYAHRLKTKGVALEEKAFDEIRSSLMVYDGLFAFLKKHKLKLPRLYQEMAEEEPNPWIVNTINQKIDERAQVKSTASKELAQIRSKLVKSRASADRIFERAVKKYRDRGLLAEFDETISENRRVLAIQSAYKGQVQGIFHGSSSKNSIVYIEPGETVEINNEIANLLDDEKQEIRRILRELSTELHPFTSHLQVVEKKLTLVDFIRAKAVFAKREDCSVPTLNFDKKEIKLREAYNPVLKIINKQKGKATIPLTLNLYMENRILVISGPNAGGKSIALKTLGILTIMLQCGVPIPVDPFSEMCVFSKLFVDIGDSQSIENELSTYSSKLQKMKHFLAEADNDTLLLIDEFGSGSDPELGSALAQVFLEKLNNFGVFGIFTTHYNAIKALAARLPGVQNGAMLFDKKNLSPEYRLEVGNPGSSYTFEVAGKSGIPPHLINEARQKTAAETLQVDKLLVKLQDDKLHLEKKKNQLNSELNKLKKLEAERAQAIARLEEKLSKQSRANEEQDRLLYWGQRFQKLVDSWMDQKGKKDKKEVVARFIGMLTQRSGEVEKEEDKTISKAQSKRDKQINELKKQEVKVGDRIKILDSGMTGTISEIKKDRYVIALGPNISSTVGRSQFIPAGIRLENTPKKKRRKKTFAPKKEQTPKNQPKGEDNR